VLNTDRDMVYSSKCETTIFEIQTWDILTGSTLFEYLNKDYIISVNRMAPDDVFLLLINPPSKNKPVQKLIAKYVFDCYEKRRSLVV